MTSPRETVLCQYHYNALDHLISHALADTPERQRFYCKSRLATEIQGAMRYSIVQQGDQLLAQQLSEGDAPETTLLATDQQRSVLQMVKANHPPQPIVYSPYGHHPAGSGLLSLLGFNGERPDPVTGCYLLGNGYRAFNPVFMRFNSPDSWSPFGKGGLNSYAYCSGDPVNRLDPDGHLSAMTVRAIGKFKLTAKHVKAKATQQDWSKNLRINKTEVAGDYTVKHYQNNIKTIEITPPSSPPTLEEIAYRRVKKQAGVVIGAPPNYRPPAPRHPLHNEETRFVNYAYNTITSEQLLYGDSFSVEGAIQLIHNKARNGQIFGVHRSTANKLVNKLFYPEPPDNIYDWISQMRKSD